MAFDLSMPTLNHSSGLSATIVHGQSLSCATMVSYSERLTQAMTAASVDKHHLAKHLGVSVQAVTKAMEGKSAALSAPNNSKAARYLGVDSDWLATGAGHQVSEQQWPFKKITLSDLHELEKLSPGAIAHIETTALGLLSLAKTPVPKHAQHLDTGPVSEPDLVVLAGRLPVKGKPRDGSSTDAKPPAERRKRVQGNS